jgi:hypothetical protein
MTDNIVQCFKTNQLNVDIDLPAVISQINKDVSQSGGAFLLNINFTLNDALNSLCDKVQEWLTTNEVDLQALLYRIDVSERDIRENVLTPERVTELIFKREIIKVRFRKQYSS